MTNFDGAVALVTGGASGIGEACVRMLAEQGARVMIADRAEEPAHALADELGGEVTACGLDVADPEGADAMVLAVLERFGRLDIAVNSAGVGMPDQRDVGDLSFVEWRRVLSINLDGVFNSMHSEIRAMLANDASGFGAGGSIVNIASVMGAVGAYGASAYVASKHGVIGLTKAAGLEYAARNIRVNAIGAGHISTPMFTRRTEGQQADVAMQYPMKRVGTPNEIARFVSFIAGPGAGFATGAFFPVDGGYLAQ